MAINQFSVIPSQQNPITFSNDMDQFLSEFNPIINQINSVNAELSPLADAAPSIVAAANYKGLWSSLAGALAIPASVYHLGKFWTLTQSVADVTTKIPGTASEWALPTSSLGGASQVSSATSITLTSSSSRVQAINMTAAGQDVTLPDATTLSTGAGLYALKNTGVNAWNLRDKSGALKAVLGAGQIVTLSLIDNGSVAGNWIVANDSPSGVFGKMIAGLNTIHNALAVTAPRITMLSSTVGIVCHVRGSTIYGSVATASGLTLSLGTEITIAASASSGLRIVAVSATQAVFLYMVGTMLKAVTLNVSGTTLSVGTAVDLHTTASSDSNAMDIVMIGSTKVIAAYLNTSGNAVNGVVLDISGTTLTLGTPYTFIHAGTSYRFGLVVSSPTRIALVLRTGSSGNFQTNVFAASLTGSTIAAVGSLYGSTVSSMMANPSSLSTTTLGNGIGAMAMVAESSSTTVFSGGVLICLFDITGSTPVLVGDYLLGNVVVQDVSIIPFGANGLILRSTNRVTGGVSLTQIDCANNRISESGSVMIPKVATTGDLLDSIDYANGKIFGVYQDATGSSDYLTSKVIEVAL